MRSYDFIIPVVTFHFCMLHRLSCKCPACTACRIVLCKLWKHHYTDRETTLSKMAVRNIQALEPDMNACGYKCDPPNMYFV